MALIEKLTAIANAIRTKTGISQKMTLDEMAAAIVGISEGSINNQDKVITENGIYTADSGFTGFGTVNVNVAPRIHEQTFSQGTFSVTQNVTAGMSYQINHNLGRVPKVFILICSNKTSSSNSCIMLMWRQETEVTMSFRNTAITAGGSVNTTYNSISGATDTDIIISVGTANGTLRTGDTYQWICW